MVQPSRASAGSYTCSTIPMERIGTVKVMCRATPVVPLRVKAKTIYQSGFVGQLERRWQGIGVVASVKTIVVVYQPGECFLGVMCRTHGRWLVGWGYNNCAVPGLSIYPSQGYIEHNSQSK